MAKGKSMVGFYMKWMSRSRYLDLPKSCVKFCALNSPEKPKIWQKFGTKLEGPGMNDMILNQILNG